jgi:hypothetical protein
VQFSKALPPELKTTEIKMKNDEWNHGLWPALQKLLKELKLNIGSAKFENTQPMPMPMV